MKKIICLFALPMMILSAGCGGGGSSSSSYPSFAPNTDSSPLSARMDSEYDNNGVIDGLYNCEITNTGLMNQDNIKYNPSVKLSINGKSDGTTKVLLAETGDPASATIFGGVDGKVSGYTFTGNTVKSGISLGGAVSMTFTFADNSGDGYMDVTGTGTVELKGTNLIDGSSYTKKATITCASVWNFE